MSLRKWKDDRRELQVLVVTTSFPLPGGSPSGPFVKRLVESMPPGVRTMVLTPCIGIRQEHQLAGLHRVVCFRYAPIVWQKLAHVPGGVPVALASNPWLYLLVPAFLLAMGGACWRSSRGMSVLHANWSVNGVVAGVIARLRGIPLITTLRGDDVTRAGISPLFRFLLARCVGMSMKVVVVSEGIRQQVVGWFPKAAGKIHFIANGISDDLMSEPPSLGIPGKLNAIVVGSLIPRKDVGVLVRALARLPSPASVRVVVLGDGPDRDGLQRLATELGVRSSLHFAGAVGTDDVAGYLRAADALVLCSRSEGRPNVVLEAMAAGAVVVATAIPGVTELVADGSTGLLFECGDEEALANHMIRLCADHELRVRLASNARSWIRDQGLFWVGTARRYAALYHECVERTGQRCAD